MGKILIIGGNAYSLVHFRGDMIKSMVEEGHEVFAMAPETDLEGGAAAVMTRSISTQLSSLGVPFIPIEKLFRLNADGSLAMNQAGANLIRARILQIPLTGEKGLSWGDGQKGKPHSVTGSAPFRFPSFSKNSKYMVAPAGPMFFWAPA